MVGHTPAVAANSSTAPTGKAAATSSRFHLRDRIRGVALIAIIVTAGMWTYPPVLAFIIVGCCAVLTLTTLIFSFLLLIYLFFLHVEEQPLANSAAGSDGGKDSKLFLHPSPVHSAHIFLSVVLHIFGLWYSAWLFSHAALILQHTTSLSTGLGVRRLMFVIVVTAAGENGGMFLGAAFGTTKCTPHISPNKTKIGAWAQVLVAGLTSAAIYLYAPWLEPHICSSVEEAAVLGVALGIIGGMGDLFESFLKRSVGVKDAGSLIPGAGGMLDRMDGLVFNFPFVYYYLEYRSHLL